jgi:DNA-binding CsgD family transcriptional regulator
LDVLDGKLICGYNLGTFIIEKDRIKRLSTIAGGRIHKHPYLDNIGYQGIYTGIALYNKDKEGNWSFSKVLKETDYTKYLEIDYEGNLWSSSAFKGVQMHQLNSIGDSIINTINFGEKEGFISDSYINVFKIGSRIVFSNGGTFFTYDYLERKIVPFSWLNTQLGHYRNSHIIYQAGPSEYWFISRTSIGQFYFMYDSLALRYEFKYGSIRSSALEYLENITKINERYYIIGLDEGIAILDYGQVAGNFKKPLPYSIIINKVQFLNQSGIIQKVSPYNASNPHITFNKRNCIVNFSVPGTSQEMFTFYYRFSEIQSWTSLGNTNVLRYNNLSSGPQLLEIKAVEESTGRDSIVKFPFTILSPFYLSWVAIIAYFIILLGLGLLARKIIILRVQHHQIEFQEKTRIENEKKIERMNQEYLQMELRNKSNELVNYSILLDKRNEFMDQLKSVISKELDDSKMPSQQVKVKLLNFIDKNISSKDEWHIFKSHFDTVNYEFLEKLKKVHKSLTPSDLRFCAFLKMNLTSKEISTLLSISLRSVEVKRYRLRKKFNLEHDKNLIEYLMNA